MKAWSHKFNESFAWKKILHWHFIPITAQLISLPAASFSFNLISICLLTTIWIHKATPLGFKQLSPSQQSVFADSAIFITVPYHPAQPRTSHVLRRDRCGYAGSTCNPAVRKLFVFLENMRFFHNSNPTYIGHAQQVSERFQFQGSLTWWTNTSSLVSFLQDNRKFKFMYETHTKLAQFTNSIVWGRDNRELSRQLAIFRHHPCSSTCSQLIPYSLTAWSKKIVRWLVQGSEHTLKSLKSHMKAFFLPPAHPTPFTSRRRCLKNTWQRPVNHFWQCSVWEISHRNLWNKLQYHHSSLAWSLQSYILTASMLLSFKE